MCLRVDEVIAIGVVWDGGFFAVTEFFAARLADHDHDHVGISPRPGTNDRSQVNAGLFC